MALIWGLWHTKASMETLISSFYFFKPLESERLPSLRAEVENVALSQSIKGIVILGTEGFNATISGPDEGVQNFTKWVPKFFEVKELVPKFSRNADHPFRKLKVRVKPEIVTMGKTEVTAYPHKATHMSPKAWNQTMEKDGVVVLDTRNWYETGIGKFKGAVEPDIENFSEFPDYLTKSELPKDKTYLIYCTGGIRCEKAAVEMHRQGFEKVYQLDGGILNYLEQFPNQKFEGDCFVFDERLAVNQELKPTGAYHLCDSCGEIAANGTLCKRCSSKPR